MTPRQFKPALGTTTVVPVQTQSSSFQRLHFSCRLDADSDSAVTPEIWTNLPHLEWHAIPFQRSNPTANYYVASVSVDGAQLGTYEYTFRVTRGDGQVQWLGSEGLNGRIELVASATDEQADQLACPFAFGTGAQVHLDTAGHCALVGYGLQNGVSGDQQTFEISLKQGEEEPDWQMATGLVIERSERIWYQPRILKPTNPLGDVSADYETSLLYLRSSPSATHPRPRIVVLFPFSTRTVSSSILRKVSSLVVRATRDTRDQDVKGYVTAAWGHDGQFKSLVERCIALARTVISNPATTQASQARPARDGLQGLSACTWNALDYERYRLSDVLPWLEGLKDSKRSSALFAGALENVLLDDGWQDTVHVPDTVDGKTDRRVLRSFGVRPEWYDVGGSRHTAKTQSQSRDSGYTSAADEAQSPAALPENATSLSGNGELADAVGRIKAMGIKRVGVWSTIAGYWDGILPNGPIAQRYAPDPLPMFRLDSDVFEAARTNWSLPPRAKLEDYYRTYYTTLRDAGVDFVKVDDQAHQDYMQNIDDSEEGDAGLMRQEMLHVMRSVSDKVFGPGTTIHCMAGSPRIWGGALGLGPAEPKSIIRASDDFFPDQDDSHRWHVFVNTHNTLLLRSLNLVPDFDMAQAGHPWGSFHIPLRAFTPAGTYTTDLPSTDGALTLWDPMLARTKSGRQIKLLKPRAEIGAVLEGRIAEADTRQTDNGEALLVGLPLPDSAGGHIGLWNCLSSDTAVASSTLDARDIHDVVTGSGPGVRGSGYVVYLDGCDVHRFSTADITAAARSHRVLAAPGPHVTLEPKGVKIATVAQVHNLRQRHESSAEPARVDIACLGLLDKHVGLAAISSIRVTDTLRRSTPSTVPPISSAAPDPCSRPPARRIVSSPSTFPRPTASRLAAMLLSKNRFGSSSQTSGSGTPSPAIGPGRSLASDLWRRPFATLWFEARALAGFALAVVLWSVGHMRGLMVTTGPRPPPPTPSPALSSSPVPAATEAAAAELGCRRGAGDQDNVVTDSQVLAIELLAVSSRLGLVVKPGQGEFGDIKAEHLRVTLDGQSVDARLVKDGQVRGLVEVDVEGAWEAAGGSDDQSETWLLEVHVSVQQ